MLNKYQRAYHELGTVLKKEKLLPSWNLFVLMGETDNKQVNKVKYVLCQIKKSFEKIKHEKETGNTKLGGS